MRERIIRGKDWVREADAKSAPGRLSARGSEVAAHNGGFVEGVCHALDVLQALGFDEAYEAGLAAMFRAVGPDGRSTAGTERTIRKAEGL